MNAKRLLSGKTENGLEIYTIDDEYVTTIADGSSFIAPTRPGIYKALDGGVERDVCLFNLSSPKRNIGKKVHGTESEATEK